MFWIRLRSSIVLVIITVIALYFGGITTSLYVTFISLCGIYELCKVYHLEKSCLLATSWVFTLIYQGLVYFKLEEYLIPLIILYLLVLLVEYVFTFPKFKAMDIAVSFFSFFYVTVAISYIANIRFLPNGGILVPIIYVCAWGNDTCAYMVGRKLGKHKMTPRLSPKKSIEGAVGGILGAALLGIIYSLIFSRYLPQGHGLHYNLIFALIGGIGAFPAIIGDLAASAIKRNHDIKDYSKLIPGHGGVLDRFDSIIFTAPIVYYLMIFLLKNVF